MGFILPGIKIGDICLVEITIKEYYKDKIYHNYKRKVEVVYKKIKEITKKELNEDNNFKIKVRRILNTKKEHILISDIKLITVVGFSLKK